MNRKFDFGGYATKHDLKCSDGRVIRHGAFESQDGAKVPLVWQHLHDQPENVLGHAVLEARKDGVYAYAYFNESPQAQSAKESVRHGDLDSLSIFANKLVQRGSDVVHGVIREVSLVLAGANPGAVIDNISLSHGDGYYESEDEAIIQMGETLELEHEDSEDDDATIQDILDGMDEREQKAVAYLISEALRSSSESAEHSEELKEGETTENKEGETLTHNAFSAGAVPQQETHTLTHDDMKSIMTASVELGSFQRAALQHAKQYGVSNIEMLFPEAKDVKAIPETISRRMEWVPELLNRVSKLPFAKVRSRQVDITADEARARGYVTASKKTESVIKALQRVTGPTTIYVKQKFDRDDIIDITDINVIPWVSGLMRTLFNEELARAILLGDGRQVGHADKINEDCIRPICGDDDLFVRYVDAEGLNLRAGEAKYEELVDVLTEALSEYRGTGTPTLYIGAAELVGMMLTRDKMGRRLYNNHRDLADAIGVSDIVRVDMLGKRGVTSATTKYQWFAAMVNPTDYHIGTNKGGELTSFEDFDIDFNQHKYLQESRLSGALTKVQSAVVLYQKGTETKAPGSD